MKDLTITFKKEDGYIIAECPGIYSLGIGNTKQDALLALCEHIKTQIECCEKHGTDIW